MKSKFDAAAKIMKDKKGRAIGLGDICCIDFKHSRNLHGRSGTVVKLNPDNATPSVEIEISLGRYNGTRRVTTTPDILDRIKTAAAVQEEKDAREAREYIGRQKRNRRGWGFNNVDVGGADQRNTSVADALGRALHKRRPGY